MAVWIFVNRDDEVVFAQRIKSRTWPIVPRTKHKTQVKIGDTAIFYQAGFQGQKFLGTAKITSEFRPIPGKIDSICNIDEIELWSNPLSIKEILSRLELVKNESYWGLYFQSAILSLSENDSSFILNNAKKINEKLELKKHVKLYHKEIQNKINSQLLKQI